MNHEEVVRRAAEMLVPARGLPVDVIEQHLRAGIAAGLLRLTPDGLQLAIPTSRRRGTRPADRAGR